MLKFLYLESTKQRNLVFSSQGVILSPHDQINPLSPQRVLESTNRDKEPLERKKL